MIKDFKENDVINDIFLLTKREFANTSTGKVYGRATLSDASGSITAYMWDKYQQLEALAENSVVAVQATVTTFNSKLQLRLVGISECVDENVDYTKLLPSSEYDCDEMLAKLLNKAKSVQDPWLQKLLHYFFNDSTTLKKFKTHPGAVQFHHAFCGGLLQHSLSVAELSDYAASMYLFVNRDLVVTTALLHDIGKLEEIQPLPAHDCTTNGSLIGHIVGGQNMVRAACNSIDGFPSQLREVVCHCILSHHEQLEWGSPMAPAIVEAAIVSMCDRLDARTQQYREAVTDPKVMFSTAGFTGKAFPLGVRVSEYERLYDAEC